MTADAFLTVEGCRDYAAHIAERLPPYHRLTRQDDTLRRDLLRRAVYLERENPRIAKRGAG